MSAAAKCALNRHPDIAVLVRKSRGAGRRDWYLLTAIDDLADVLREVAPDDALSIFLTPQFPLRGPVDESFANRCRRTLDSIEDMQTELVVGIREPGRVRLGSQAGFEPGDAVDLAEWVGHHHGEQGVAGLAPDDWSDHPAEHLTAYVPRADGSIHIGPY